MSLQRPEISFCSVDPVDQPADNSRRRHAPAGVQRRVKEHFSVFQVAQPHPVLKRLIRAAGKVFPFDDGGRHHPEDHQELLDRVVGIEFTYVVRWERDVLAGEIGEGRGADGPLEMAVQLDLRNFAQEFVGVHQISPP
jgi:hypothetical protein